MVTTGHEKELVNVEDLKATLQKYKTDISDNKADLVNGKVPASQLQSYVDDAIELLAMRATAPETCAKDDQYYNTSSAKIFTATAANTWGTTGVDPEKGKIYVNLSNDRTYRWGGSAMVPIKGDLVIGTSAGDAADGKVVDDHIKNTSNPHGVTASQVGLGNVGNFKAVSTAASQGLDSTEQSNARANIGLGSLATKSSLAASDIPTITKSKISDFPSSMPASDVSAWAKAANKPSYTLDEVSDGSVRKLADKIGKTINTTWANLKSLRDNSQLVPGQFYRITDYTCTTTQANTQSAGHAFDVIVRADDVNVLNEDAYAALHSGDTYFANSKLEAWKLSYCLDNDTNRFTWADSTNGKGVIYYMKDEWDNECPYDFKNFQMKLWKVTFTETRVGIIGSYYLSLTNSNSGLPSNITVPDSDDYIWCYTFDRHGADCSIATGDTIFAYNNKIAATYYDDEKLEFSPNCFLMMAINNTINGTKNSISLSTNNTIEGSLNILYSAGWNILKQQSNKNFLHSSNNILEGECKNIFIPEESAYNHFGLACENITLKMMCRFNTFGDYCRNITCNGQSIWGNTFDSCCNNISLSQNCYKNYFGKGCENITIEKSYFYFNIIENGNKYITLTSTQTTGSSAKLQNIKICQGVNNTTTTKTISHDTLNDTFQTEYKPANSQVISV